MRVAHENLPPPHIHKLPIQKQNLLTPTQPADIFQKVFNPFLPSYLGWGAS